MRRAVGVPWVVVAVCALLAGNAALSQGGIVGSRHDFSQTGWADQQICVPCHTPHQGQVTAGPLWNHTLPSTTYTLYASNTLKVQPGEPGAQSRLCLSCHDGTVALDSFGNRGGTVHMGAGTSLIGTDLSDDHPVGIRWQHQNKGVSCANCHRLHMGGSSSLLNSPLPFYGTAHQRTIECSTCHEPHNLNNEVHLLRLSLDHSKLCFQCHGV
jgi:predicted CXXCH cytochrome family protein